MFHLLAGGGIPPFVGPLELGLEFDPSDGAGAGRMGKFITFWLVLLDVRTGYEGRGGAGAVTEPLAAWEAEPLLSAGGVSRSFSLIVAAGAVGAR